MSYLNREGEELLEIGPGEMVGEIEVI